MRHESLWVCGVAAMLTVGAGAARAAATSPGTAVEAATEESGYGVEAAAGTYLAMIGEGGQLVRVTTGTGGAIATLRSCDPVLRREHGGPRSRSWMLGDGPGLLRRPLHGGRR